MYEVDGVKNKVYCQVSGKNNPRFFSRLSVFDTWRGFLKGSFNLAFGLMLSGGRGQKEALQRASTGVELWFLRATNVFYQFE